MSETTEQVLELELNSDCVCVKYDPENDCDLLDENGNTIPAESCLGCWQDALESWHEWFFPEWIERNNLRPKSRVVIEYSHVTWRSGSGEFPCLVEDLSDGHFGFLSGDFRIRWMLVGKNLEAHRYSHDEPTGAYFKFKVGKDAK